MKRFLGTSACALLLAANPAAAQVATGQMTDPAATNPGQTVPRTPGDMAFQPRMNEQNIMGNPVQAPMDQTNTSQRDMDSAAAPPPLDQVGPSRNTMGQSPLDQPAAGQVIPNQNTMDQPGPGQNTMDRGTMDRSTMDRGTMDRGTMDSSTADQTTAAAGGSTGRATSPDGTNAFGIEPYFGILGGYDSYDRTTTINGNRTPRLDGAQIEGLVGVNIPFGAVFVGVEGHAARGFADIRWEYGVRGRGGFRIGDSGLIYASGGYTWTEVRGGRGFADRKSWVYGIGVEAGPRDIGLGGVTSRSGPRFRLSVETADFDSIRPMAGVIFHF